MPLLIIQPNLTAVGQLALDCDYLPETLRRKLRELIAEQYKHTLEG